MSQASCISLIDLSQQLPFEIDEKLKKELCFAETLVISCCHYEGDPGDNISDSTWTCEESVKEKESDLIESIEKYELESIVEEEKASSADSIEDFQFYFFPDCSLEPKVQDSKDSIIIVDGLPRLNPAAKLPAQCTCVRDKEGKCECFTKLPCICDVNKEPAPECICSELKGVCICHSGVIHTECTCKESEVCICHPDNKPRPICTCGNDVIPCICEYPKRVFPVCNCEDPENCQCQVPKPKPKCYCLKDKDCICLPDSCICGIHNSCLCLPEEDESIQCSVEENSSCSCNRPECKCNKSPSSCACFDKKECTCGDPDDCKCYIPCECIKPCICDVKLTENKDKECVCKIMDVKKAENKLKKVRVSKQGYRWCHEVDPQHTFFDYAYGRHDKISHEPEPETKVKILGLHEEKVDDNAEVETQPDPQFKKSVKHMSLDCCSAVGGISISVETLGEDKDKLLIQVVSHSAKQGAKSGTKLVSIIDCNLHTMEENRTENITKLDITKEMRSYMAICDTGYYNKVTRICGERCVVKRHYHSFDDAHDFLLEGANLVLMRYFGLRRYRGTVKTKTVLLSGVICESVYVCQGVSQAIVNGKPLFVVKVSRHIIEPSGFLQETLTVLTLRGYIVSHEWAHHNYVLHVNPLLNIIPEKDEIEQHEALRKNWRKDLQLLSDYLDFKSKRTSEGARYASESGALTGAIKDYLQALLMLRPADALQFTRHYFGATLSALDLPHDEYFDSSSKHVRYFYFED